MTGLIPAAESFEMCVYAAIAGGVLGFLLCSILFSGKMAIKHGQMAKEAMGWKKKYDEMLAEHREWGKGLEEMTERHKQLTVDLNDLMKKNDQALVDNKDLAKRVDGFQEKLLR